jgi:outer membrane lipase/esterase
MKKFHVLATALAATAFLAGCGGNDAGNQTPRVGFTQMVSFGDSLSDVGTYDVGVVAAAGGGHYSINGAHATGLAYTNWTEFLSATLQLTQPCAAETGLNTLPVKPGYAPVPATFHDTGALPCLDYAQGGARVTAAVGPGNAALFNPADSSTYSNAIGQLTVPVVTQIGNYLAHNGGTFNDKQIVTVFAGGNDIFINLALVQAGQMTVTQAVTAMGTAGAEEAGYVQSMILAKGATHVVVINLPDVSITPLGLSQTDPNVRTLIKTMVTTFNDQLKANLTASASLLYVDAFTTSEDQAANMSQYGLTNVSTPACDLTVASSSLICSKATLISAVAPASASDPATAANGYEYADSVHPTPYGYRLLAELVGEQMAIKGWL